MRGVVAWLLCGFLAWAQERIVSLSPALTEIIFDLGAGAEVVATTHFSTYPAEVSAVPKIGGYMPPSLETVLALKPTLVVGHAHHRAFLEKLEALGLRTQLLPAHTLEDIQSNITFLARYLNRAPQALLEPIKKALHQPRTLVTPPPRVLIVFGTQESLAQGVYVAGIGIYYEEILESCGGVNAYQSDFLGQPALGYEALLALNPDRVIILHAPQTQSVTAAQALKQWQALPIAAARRNAIHVLSNDAFMIPSHRVAQTITAICEVVHDH